MDHPCDKFPDIAEGFIPVTGGRVWYRAVGLQTKGIPLLTLHGGPGAPHDYLENLEALSDERPVIFYDQLGCGNSDRPDDPSLWTIDRFAEELMGVREFLRLEKVHILGVSWGTMLLTDYLLTRKPRGIAGLIMSGSCLSASRWALDQRYYVARLPFGVRTVIERCEASGDFSSQAYQDAMMVYYRRHLCRLDPWPESLNRTFEKMGANVYRHMWGPSEFTITGTLKDYERAERLGEIKIPTLFTCGQFDEASPEATALYSQQLPGSERVVFESASHAHHLEKPDEYLSAVRNFLKRTEDLKF